MTRQTLRTTVIALLAPLAIYAQVSTGEDARIVIETMETDIVSCDFVGRTFAGPNQDAGYPTVTLRKEARSDGSPSSIITASDATGSTLRVTIAPDTGCASAGCRRGNVYQVRMKGTDGNSNEVTCNIRVDVLDKVYLPE